MFFIYLFLALNKERIKWKITNEQRGIIYEDLLNENIKGFLMTCVVKLFLKKIHVSTEFLSKVCVFR